VYVFGGPERGDEMVVEDEKEWPPDYLYIRGYIMPVSCLLSPV
jgi:hypothetical protein